MALRLYKNKISGEERQSLKTLPKDEWEEILQAPGQKFMVSANKSTGTSKLKDSQKILTARARNYARDVELDDNIAINKTNGLDQAVAQNFLNKTGKRRTKLDDI
jgi:hypothetical protein